VLLIDWDALVTDRDPTVPDYKDYGVGKDWWKTYDKKDAERDLWDTSKWGTHVDLTEDETLYECLLDAQQGFLTGVIGMMAESVYPDDPKAAIKFINRSKITDEVITMAMGMVGRNDVDSILCTMFDMAYAE
jgi:hypothetical protein